MKLTNNFRRDYGKVRNEWQDEPEAAEEEQEDALPEDISPEFPYRPQDNGTPAASASHTYSQPRTNEGFTSVIGAGSTWNGNFSTEGSVRLDGKVSGDVNAAGTVHISEGAEVNANVNASYVTIGGTFDGKLVCTDRLELLATSRVKGSITTRLISIAEGAVMDGEIHMGSEVKEREPVLATSRLFATNGAATTTTNGAAAEPATNGSEEKPVRTNRGR